MNPMTRTRWAVLGPGAISTDFVAGLGASAHGMLHAVGSSQPARAAAFAREHGADVSGTYDEILARDDVDAVYIGTVHTTHADLAIRALEAGKAVLCEKPASPTVAEVQAIIETAARTGQVFLEAFKTRFGPFAAELRRIIRDGDLGAPTSAEAAFGFAAGSHTGRLFDPAVGGGAILDVGCYPVALFVDIAAASGADLTAMRISDVRSRRAGAVDGSATAGIQWAGVRATASCSIVEELPAAATIRFERGEVILPDAWGGRAVSATTLHIVHEGHRRTVDVPAIQPMAAEADAVSLALAEGRLEAPEMPWAHSLAVAEALTEWRRAAGSAEAAQIAT